MSDFPFAFQQFKQYEAQYFNLLTSPPKDGSLPEKAATLISQFLEIYEYFTRNIYSSNDHLTEYSIPQMRFFAIPYYVAHLHTMFNGQARPQHLEEAQIFFEKYQELAIRFKLIDKVPNPRTPEERREYAIQNHQITKRLQQISEKYDLDRGAIGDPVDEEDEEKRTIDLLKLFAEEANAALKNVKDEIPLAKMFAQGVKPEQPAGPPPKMWVKKIDRQEMINKVFAPLEDIMPQPLPPDDETFASPGKPKDQLDASDDEEAERARKEAARWDDWKDDHPPFSAE